MKEEDDFCVYGNKDVVFKFRYKIIFYYRAGFCIEWIINY